MRVLAINDVSCVGKCSLTVTLPIVSACGVTCNVLPTAILSTHTGGFENYTFHDLTPEIPKILAHWKSLNLRFDYICSGYLGDEEQIDFVAQIKREFLAENGVFIVDPVMGDSGKLYDGFTIDYVEKMRWLCAQADYILPNVTEACLLANLPYPLDENSAKEAFFKLKDICPHPIITGITGNHTIGVLFGDENNEPTLYQHENIDGFFCGAGDVLTSAFTGALAKGKSAKHALCLASDFTAAAIARSKHEVPDKRFGLNFEAEIASFVQRLNN